MSFTDPMVWQALSFTSLNLLFIATMTWWLFFSPLSASAQLHTTPSKRLGWMLAGVMGAVAALLMVGAYWDTSMHIQTGTVPGGDDFLWPPHMLLYGAFAGAFAVGLAAFSLIARQGLRAGITDPRQWVRRNPYLGGLMLAAVYALAAIPGDALWHELFGIDLTAWSPPHILLTFAMCLVVLGGAGALRQTHRPSEWFVWHELMLVYLFSGALVVSYFILTIEWEQPLPLLSFIQARPLWLYPLVGGASAYVLLLTAKQLSTWRWLATSIALCFYVERGLINGLMQATGNVVFLSPLWFIGGALLLDLVPWQRIASTRWRDATTAALFTVGYVSIALPLLQGRAHLPLFTGFAVSMVCVSMFIAGMLLAPLARLLSRKLQGDAQATAAATALKTQALPV